LRDLHGALGLLPAEQRGVILLIGLEGMSYNETDEVLGIPTGTVRSRLSRGRRELMDIDHHPSRRQNNRSRIARNKSRYPS
jgi:DNA-directed RNA polymerase specialized sigma24 family protein